MMIVAFDQGLIAIAQNRHAAKRPEVHEFGSGGRVVG
jgi:hypothetical protein